jgi:tRNA C32,U32 (ribose-2'-O)-methylase TrmJ
LLFTALANVGPVADALANIPKDELRTMTNEEVFAANAWVRASESDGVVLAARILA